MRNILMGMAAAAALVFAPPAAADTVSDWWEFANKLAPPGGGGAPDQMRSTSRVSLAMFEALNAIDRRYQSYLNLPAGDPTASQDAAAVTAAYLVLVQHYPAQKTALDDSYAIAMQAVQDPARREAGRLIGEQAAAAAMAAGGIDPAIVQTPYRPVTRPGQWISTPLPQIEPFMSAFRPWVIPSAQALRPPPPPALTSEQWARDYAEVLRLGGRTSTERTPTQTLAARYRQAFDLTPSMRLAADAPGRTPVQNARMFAVYQMAFDDAVLAMSAAKAHYDFWRPITAIRNAADDGNDATAPDAGWVPLLTTPNFAEYPCGHCTVAGALGEVMKAEVGPRPATGVRVASQAIPNSAVQVLPSWD
ncbi:MAG: vanadium-dependent haloperoxidase, partial [Brevundimonas sp.]